MNLSWDANTEADLAGYLVLRGEAPGDTLQPLTPAPITGTSLRRQDGYTRRALHVCHRRRGQGVAAQQERAVLAR